MIRLGKRFLRIWIGKGQRLQNGIKANKGESGMLQMPGNHGDTEANPSQRNANPAEKDSNAGCQIPNSAQTNANPNIEGRVELIMKGGFAGGASRYLRSINTNLPNIAQEYAHAETYNLTVEIDHVYYANGILVGNCLDALRYGITSFMHKKAKETETPKRMSEVAVQKNLRKSKQGVRW
jgi:hypothetical protein